MSRSQRIWQWWRRALHLQGWRGPPRHVVSEQRLRQGLHLGDSFSHDYLPSQCQAQVPASQDPMYKPRMPHPWCC